MSERECALKNPYYLKLKHVYENREEEARKWRNSGRSIALTLGSDVPEEMLVAAGYLPIAVHSDYDRPTDTDLYLEESCTHDAWAKGVAQKLVDGTYKSFAERLVISYSTMRMYNLFNVLTEANRLIADLPIPYVYFLDLDYAKTLFGQTHNIRIYNEFKKAIESWTGKELDGSRLLEAVNLYNEFRATLAEFDQYRWQTPSRVTGTEALTVIGAAMFMDKKDHMEIVKELIKDVQNWPEVSAPRVFITGTDQDIPELYELVESLGGNVVTEDQNFGARYYTKNVEYFRDPIRGISDRYMYRMPTGRVNVCERVETVKECVLKSKADAVIMYLKVNDIGDSWDYPSIKEMLDSLNIPIVRFYDQETPMSNKDVVKEAISKMLDGVKGGKANG